MNELKTIDIARQYEEIKGEIWFAIKEVLEKQSFILGEQVEKLEKDFAKYCNVKYGVGCSSGTSALFLAIEALELNKEAEIITTPFTFIATASSIISANLKPVFVDIDEKTYNIDFNKIEKAITKNTKAIIPVHLYGQPCDMKEIMESGKKHNLYVIEDCAQAHGALYKNQKIGSFGIISCFSFYPGKNLGAYGDAGIILTSDEKIYDRLILLRNHGRHTKYYHEIHGYNHRIDGIQAAVLNVKLKYLDKWNKRRREIAKLYNEYLKETDLILPYEKEARECVYHLYVVRHPKRDKIITELKKHNIISAIHYNLPLHLQPCMKGLGYKKGDFPVAEKVADEVFSLPMFPELKDEEVFYISDVLKKILKNL
ncbi:MAG TPA: DegT/DnrJ/EryC1/StrS family aminotransferase [bacterium]|nr:DegT/DnrJ/EryC1/StrS family aminotransferase [bacterium]HOL48490.1 DegT/DnrJ/EryC1/StrS family aminotransferase [bacterium]HPQ19181.1 DegT/DnrJ/EryC1/StrS family aminotransferase [bacterium]